MTTEERGSTGVEGVEAKDASKHPRVYRSAPTTKSFQTKNVNNPKVEKS